MSNVTYVPTIHDYVVNIFYMVEGFLMVVGNSLTMLAILTHKSLRRKETLLLVGMAGADLVSGVGFWVGGYHRLQLTIHRTALNKVSGWACMLKFQTVFFIVGAESQGLMQFLISLDRMIALTFMHKYNTLGRSYTLTLLGCVTLHGIITGIICFVSSYLTLQDKFFPAVCIGPWAIPPWMANYYTTLSAVGGLLSVGLYAFVIIGMCMKKGGSSQTEKLQRKFTQTIGVITLFTLIFHSIPYTVVAVLKNFYAKEAWFGLISRYLWATVNINSLMNVAVYIFRMREVRAAMKNLLLCKIGDVSPSLAGSRVSATKGSRVSDARRASIISDTRRGSNAAQLPGEVRRASLISNGGQLAPVT